MGAKSSSRWLLVLAFATGCGFDSSGTATIRDAGSVDAASGTDADVDGSAAPGARLVISEVKTLPSDLQFVEVYNRGCEPAALDRYYLADDSAYASMPAWATDPPELSDYDAIVRFPSGATLHPGEVAVVARYSTAFVDAYGFAPSYRLLAAGPSAQMVFVASGWRSDLFLLNRGESLVLFSWDGQRDLVEDVDVVIAGDTPLPEDELVAKQTLPPVDGPDDDNIATVYRTDSVTMLPMAARDADGSSAADRGSYQRMRFEDGYEIATGGNGVDGHDETSEDTRMTWEQDVGTVPTPGSVPASLVVDCGS